MRRNIPTGQISMNVLWSANDTDKNPDFICVVCVGVRSEVALREAGLAQAKLENLFGGKASPGKR